MLLLLQTSPYIGHEKPVFSAERKRVTEKPTDEDEDILALFWIVEQYEQY